MAASSRATMRLRSSSVFRFSGRAKCDDASQWGSLLIQARAAHRASSSSVNNNSGFIARSPGSRAGPDTDYRSDDLYGHLSGLRRGLRKKIAQGGPKCNPQNYQDRGRNYWKFPNFARAAQKDVPGLRSEAEETRLAPTQPQSGARRQEKGQADCGVEPPGWAPGMLTCGPHGLRDPDRRRSRLVPIVRDLDRMDVLELYSHLLALGRDSPEGMPVVPGDVSGVERALPREGCPRVGNRVSHPVQRASGVTRGDPGCVNLFGAGRGDRKSGV